MRKELYQALKDRLSHLIVTDSGDIVFVSAERMAGLEKTGKSPERAIKHIGLWNRQGEVIQEAEFHLDLLDKINRCLHGFGGESWGSFKRSASIPCHDHEEILDDTEVFQAVVYDTSSMKKLVKCPVSPGMSIRTK